MTTLNHFFNNHENVAEQNLYHDLVIEAIRQFGMEMVYLPRHFINKDQIYLEDDQSTFGASFPIEMYIKSLDGFTGEGSIMSKFGLEIRDSVTFSVAARRFEEEIGRHLNFFRPREADLIYFPLNDKVFEIKFVENKPFFYQFGTLPTFECFCELFEYSSEVFKTSIPAIDRLNTSTMNILNYVITDENGRPLVTPRDYNYILQAAINTNTAATDPLQDNQTIANSAAEFIDWTSINPFADHTGII